LKRNLLLIALLILVLAVGCSRGASQEDGEYAPVINKDNPGETLEITEHLVPGKITIFDFYSDYCPPCKTISPMLTELDKARPDIAVKKIDINRKGKTGIDWQSPVVEQYKIKSVPFFMIYDEKGKLTASERKASEKVFEYIDKMNAGN
jgi:thiol-disulfide isomerase/thioredoxin